MKTRKGLSHMSSSLFLILSSLLSFSYATLTVVVLDQSNPSISNFTFLAQESRFGPALSMMGVSGPILDVENLGCYPFQKPFIFQNVTSWIALVKRGDCTFETKVYNSQVAGASFVFVYNNVSTFGNSLIAMNGGPMSDQIKISSAFISKENGEKLNEVIQERGNLNSILLVLPSTKPTSSLGGVSGHWAVIVFVGILAILISSFFILIFLIVEIYRQRRRRGRRRRSKRVPQEVIIKIPIQKVTEEDLKNEEKNLTCAICLDDYQLDDATRKLPCDHEFHQACIDPWFHRNRLCPVCKRDVQNGVEVIYKPRTSRSSRDTRDSSLDSNRPSDIEMQSIPRESPSQLGRIAEEEGEPSTQNNITRSISAIGLLSQESNQSKIRMFFSKVLPTRRTNERDVRETQTQSSHPSDSHVIEEQALVQATTETSSITSASSPIHSKEKEKEKSIDEGDRSISSNQSESESTSLTNACSSQSS